MTRQPVPEPTFDAQAVKTKLSERLAELERLADAGGEARAPVELDQASVGRLSRMDAMQGQAMAIETQRRREVERRRIERTLARIEAGEYGWCTACGEEIGSKRLALDPTVPTCIGCAG